MVTIPYESAKQRRFMYATHPEIAKRREAEGKAYVKSTKKTAKKASPKPRKAAPRPPMRKRGKK